MDYELHHWRGRWWIDTIGHGGAVVARTDEMDEARARAHYERLIERHTP